MQAMAAVSLAIVALSTGCGTILHGTRQQIGLMVTPPGSQVSVYRWDGQLVAGPSSSPGTITVPRPRWNQPYTLVAQKPGYCPKYLLSDSSDTVGGVLSVLLLTAGSLIDQNTGAAWNIRPDPVVLTLSQDASCRE